MLEIQEISKSYGGTKALNKISLSLNKGDVLGLLGPNGAGKSTLINILSCITQPDSGNILLNNKNIKVSIDDYKRQIGVVPQEIALYQELSAYDNLMFWGSLYNVPRKDLKDKTHKILKVFGLFERRLDKIRTYSGGMKRKINIACSLLHSPSVLFMDEPTVGLDLESRFSILELIETLNSSGITIIYTTHNMEVAERLCNKIAIINEGNILTQGSLSDLKEESGIQDTVTLKLKNVNTLSLDKIPLSPSSYRINHELNTILVECKNLNNSITDIINGIQNSNGEILSIETNASNLEGVFMKLTGKPLKN